MSSDSRLSTIIYDMCVSVRNIHVCVRNGDLVRITYDSVFTHTKKFAFTSLKLIFVITEPGPRSLEGHCTFCGRCDARKNTTF